MFYTQTQKMSDYYNERMNSGKGETRNRKYIF